MARLQKVSLWMPSKHHYKNSSGQSLVEVLIITVLVASILTAIASVVTRSLHSTAENRQKNTATNFSQEAMEMFRRNRQILGWASFQSELSSGTYCLNTLPADATEFAALTPDPCGEGEVVAGTEFSREAEVTSDSAEVVIRVTVSWNPSSPREVSISQEFRDILD